MGSGIVKNLLNSGHKVTVWNRTSQKATDFAKLGAKVEKKITRSQVTKSFNLVTLLCPRTL